MNDPLPAGPAGNELNWSFDKPASGEVIPSCQITGAPNAQTLHCNAVTLGDYERPLLINQFVKDLFAGFQILNLKNDSLRRRGDGLKYTVPISWLPKLGDINRTLADPLDRFNAVMNAAELFTVEPIAK